MFMSPCCEHLGDVPAQERICCVHRSVGFVVTDGPTDWRFRVGGLTQDFPGSTGLQHEHPQDCRWSQGILDVDARPADSPSSGHLWLWLICVPTGHSASKHSLNSHSEPEVCKCTEHLCEQKSEDAYPLTGTWVVMINARIQITITCHQVVLDAKVGKSGVGLSG